MKTKRASSITEREVAAELAGELDRVIQQGGTPFDRATVEHRSGVGYPDITIWSDYATSRAFAIWELKRPGLREDLSKLPQKAQSLGAKYVVVWNFQEGELYEVARGCFGPRGQTPRGLLPRKSYPVPLLNSLEEWRDFSKRIRVIGQARQILEDLASLARGQSLTPYVPDKFYFIGILERAIYNLSPVLQDYIFQKKRDHRIRKEVEAWAVKQGYPISLPNLDELLARHWAYSLAVRILFYFTVRRRHPNLPDLRPDGHKSIADLLKEAFSQARGIDWEAIFAPSPLDGLGLPEEAEPILKDLLDDFHRYDFSSLKEDVIGQIMEGLVPEEERHALGQYFTREDLVDLIIGFVVHRPDGFYLDPTCGSGTFLTRLYSRLRWLSGYRMGHGQLLERIWGIDIAHFPAELATVNLFRQDVSDITNFPRVAVRDFFEVRPGEVFSFPPLRREWEGQGNIATEMPTFDGIVGNFPYIRQELIERQVKGYKRDITLAIAREWFWKDPDLFRTRGIDPIDPKTLEDPEGWLERRLEEGRIDLRLSGQADIYAYLFLHAAAFLKEGGRMGIVTSNAWLDVAYGVELKRFFLRRFKIVAIVASWAEPWFEDAAVNTAFVILERCEDKEERAKNIVRFVKVKKPLAELLPRDLLLEEDERWRKVDALVRQIENAEARLVSWDPTTGQVHPLEGVHTVETDEFRIRLVPQVELERELSAKRETAKWGLYIRAPQVYFDLLKEAGDKLVPLGKVAEVRRGYTTGINDFFYLEPLGPGSEPGTVRVKNARGWVGEVEEACLRPVIKSPKEAEGLVVDPKALKYRLFLPPIAPLVAGIDDPDKVLKVLETNYPLAHAYVEWGEGQRTPQGVPWPQVPSVRGRKAWWLLPDREPGRILMPMINDRRFVIFQNRGAYVDHNLFELLISAEEDLVAALMNSTLFALIRETASRVNLGDGATKTEGVDWKNSILLVSTAGISDAAKRAIVNAYTKLKTRLSLPIAQEVKQKDRQALDRAVLEALGLDPDKYLPQIYRGLVEMVEERLALPKLRQARKEKEKRMSFEQIKERVKEEVLPGGLKPITAFLLPGKLAMEEVALSGRPVSWRVFLTELLLLDAQGKEVGRLQGDESRARYAVYAAALGGYLVQVPADPTVAGQTVQKYEGYLRQVAEELVHRALQATRDHRQAERILREILESFHLPPVAVSVAMGG